MAVRRVNITMPAWLKDEIDREAKRLGVSRSAFLSTATLQFIAEHSKQCPTS